MPFGEQVTVALIRNIAWEKYVIPESKGGIFLRETLKFFLATLIEYWERKTFWPTFVKTLAVFKI